VNWRRSSGGRPHFHCRAAKQQLGKGTEERKEVFTIFFKKGIQTKFKLTFELNKQKIDAPTCMQQ
jgi:hypothetical protein